MRALTDNLRAICGEEGVLDTPGACAIYAQDVWAAGVTPDLVVRPGSTSELAQALTVLSAEGRALYPRGGGMSYTKGFTPDAAGGVTVDLGQMKRVLEINEADGYVRVEAGCTWADLHAALKPKGLRTPFWGPLSGLMSTIGGGLSQHNAFFGAGTYGGSAESVLSLTVVLADGSVVTTGSAARVGAKPFFRPFGPDLTGIFLGDCGAFGFKAEAVLRLVEQPDHERWGSFAFENRAGFARAMAEMARTGLACELFGFDPGLQKVRMKRASMAADAKTLGKVVTGQKNILKGLAEGARMAVAGRNFLEEEAHSLHFVTESHSKAAADEAHDRLAGIARKAGGKAIEPTIPKVVRANPFTPLNNMLGPDGERWVPVHGIVALSDAPACWEAIEAEFAARKNVFDRLGIQTGTLLTTLSTTAFLIEPVFLWPEALMAIHERAVEASWLKKLPRHAPNPDATAAVAEARQAVIDVFARFGGTHFQIGRTYPWRGALQSGAARLADAIKAALDPAGVTNPGVLGFSGET